jgi:4-amino-4-deoxy-L-arabinose transferase-like glycosyltransferase
VSRFARLAAHGATAAAIVLACSVLLRLFMVLRTDPSSLPALYTDAQTYFAPARSLVATGEFLDQHGRPMFHRTPGYPVLVAAIMLAAGDSPARVGVIQAVLLSLGPLLIYGLARRLLSPTAALLAGLVSALSPWSAVLAGAPLSDGLFVVMLSAIFLGIAWTAARAPRGAVAGSAAVGVLAGALVLVRPFWPLVLLIPAALAYSVGVHRRLGWAVLAVAVIGAAVPPALWVARNHAHARFDGLSDISGQAAWHYLAARVRADVGGLDRHETSALAAREEATWGYAPNSPELDRERWDRATAVFRQYPVRTAYAFVASAIEHAVHPSHDVLTPARLNFPADRVVLGVCWAVLLLLAARGVWRVAAGRQGPLDSRHRVVLALTAVAVVLVFSSGVSFAAGSRLRAPLEAVVAVLVPLGLGARLSPIAGTGESD